MIQLSKTTRSVKKEIQSQALQGYEKFIQRTDVGFLNFFRDEKRFSEQKREIQEYAETVRENFDHLVVVGIGGSSLGPKTIIEALGSKDKTVSFIENVDGEALDTLFQNFKDLSKVHWVFISKSGGTRETLSLLDAIYVYLQNEKIELSNCCSVISEPVQNLLTEWAQKQDVKCLELPVDIGGRYSVLSAVGMFPAAFAGHRVEDFYQGALWALQQDSLNQELVAQTLESFSQEEWFNAFWIYSSRFSQMGRWIQQLWAESLAKKEDRSGNTAPQVSVPLPLVGSTDQHSVLQQLSDGRERKFVWFLRVTESEKKGVVSKNAFFSERTGLEGKPLGHLMGAFAESTQEALFQSEVQSLTLKLEKLSPQTLGAAFMMMKIVVGALGETLNVNAFDQPGVELGKKLVSNYI